MVIKFTRFLGDVMSDSIHEMVWQKVVVVSRFFDGATESTGSGFVWGSNLVVTAAHCVAERNRVVDTKNLCLYEITHPSTGERCGVKDIEFDNATDLALLLLQESPFAEIKGLEFSKSNGVSSGP